MNHSHSPPAAAEPQPAAEPAPEFAAFVGIDWADQEHAVCLLDGERLRREVLPHTPEAIAAWAAGLARDFGGRPVAVMLEQSRGPLLQALTQYPQLVLFPIHPKQAARYRQALVHSGRKDDPTDAHCLARFVREHHRQLRAWRPADAATRQLGQLVELRRKAVESRQQTTQQAEARLKQYFPLALELGDTPLIVAVLERWPTHQTLARANPATLRKFFAQQGRRNADQVNELVARIRAAKPLTTDRPMIDPHALAVKFQVKELRLHEAAVAEFDAAIAQCFAAHPDAQLFRSPPDAGAALAPRLLVAFGPDRDRFASAEEVQAYSGIAPVTKRSGKSCHVTNATSATSSSAKRSTSSLTTPASGALGPKPSTNTSAPADTATTPPSAPAPSNGSASSSVAGKTANPTTKTTTSNNSAPKTSPTSTASNPLDPKPQMSVQSASSAPRHAPTTTSCGRHHAQPQDILFTLTQLYKNGQFDTPITRPAAVLPFDGLAAAKTLFHNLVAKTTARCWPSKPRSTTAQLEPTPSA